MGLRSRLVISVVGLAAFILVGWSGLLAYKGVSTLRGEARTRTAEVLKVLAVPSEIALAERRVDALDPILEGAQRSNPDLRWIAVLDSEGAVLAHSDSRHFGQQDDSAFTDRALAEGGYVWKSVEVDGEPRLLAAMPIVTASDVGQVRWGTLVTSFSMVSVDEAVGRLQLNLALASLLMLMVMAGALSLLLRRQVIQPLTNLNAAAQAIREGDLSARIAPPEGGAGTLDELHLLRGVFNEMARQIEGQTSILEGRVARRTAELEAANSELARINQRLSRAVARLADIAKTDGLTGLLNHRSFQEKLALELQRCLRQEHPLSIVMLDVDHFKSYNDMHGHPAGDFVLKEVSRIFRENLREVDVVARYGGEEFAIVLLDTPKGAAGLVAEKLRLAIQEHDFPHAGQSQPQGRMTVSVGVSSFPDDGLSPAELVETADLSLYEAKRRGRNRVVLAGEILSMLRN